MFKKAIIGVAILITIIIARIALLPMPTEAPMSQSQTYVPPSYIDVPTHDYSYMFRHDPLPPPVTQRSCYGQMIGSTYSVDCHNW